MSQHNRNAILNSNESPVGETLVTRRPVAAFVGFWLACSACAGTGSPMMASIEASDTVEGALLRAIEAAEPALYVQIAATVENALATGQAPLRAVASARTDYYVAALKRLKWASDDETLAERDASIARLEYLLAHDPVACAKASTGDSSAATASLPDEMLRSEMARFARIMQTDTSGPPRDALSREEIESLIDKSLTAHPERYPALSLFAVFRNTGPATTPASREDAIGVCDVNIKLIRDALELPRDMQPKHQRAMVGFL